MILRYILFSLICFSPLTSQWLSFDLSKADISTFKEQVEPTIISSALTGGQSTMLSLTQNQRLGITVSMPMGWALASSSYQSNPLLHPFMVEGQFLVTGNLVLKGKMNLFSNDGETVQAAGYGCNYLAESWFTSISFGWLEGPAHLRVRYVDSAIIGNRTIAETPILFGIGFNKFSGSILEFDNVDIPRKIDNFITYLIAGTEYQFGGIDINLQTQIHPKFIQLNLTISRLFF